MFLIVVEKGGGGSLVSQRRAFHHLRGAVKKVSIRITARYTCKGNRTKNRAFPEDLTNLRCGPSASLDPTV